VVENFSSENGDNTSTMPRDKLLQWLNHAVETDGQAGKLSFTVNKASLSKVDEKQHAAYNITVTVTGIGKYERDTMEMNIVVENDRTFTNVATKDQKMIALAQVDELLALLQRELSDKGKLYFAEYMTIKLNS
jgi:hypothetical protein